MAKPGTLKIDHHVLSAEGTRYIVRYVAVRTYDDVTEEQADLAQLQEDGSYASDYGSRITLPTAELRRVVAREQVPIAGMPSKRPRCVMCDGPLAPEVDSTHDKQWRTTSRTFTGWKGYRTDRTNTSWFCTHACEADFARAAWAAGYRIVRKKGGQQP